MRDKRSFKRPSPATAIAIAALVLALSGSAIAGTQLAKNSVGARQLKSKAVRTGKIANDAVNSRKVADHSLTGQDINLGALGKVPAATEADHAGGADRLSGYSASCPGGAVLLRGSCFDGSPSGPVASLGAAADACAARGGWLPGPMELYSVRSVINLGTGVGSDHVYTDSYYGNTNGGAYSTIVIDGTGALSEQEPSDAARYVCTYPLVH